MCHAARWGVMLGNLPARSLVYIMLKERIGVLLFDDFNFFDVVGPAEVFAIASELITFS